MKFWIGLMISLTLADPMKPWTEYYQEQSISYYCCMLKQYNVETKNAGNKYIPYIITLQLHALGFCKTTLILWIFTKCCSYPGNSVNQKALKMYILYKRFYSAVESSRCKSNPALLQMQINKWIYSHLNPANSKVRTQTKISWTWYNTTREGEQWAKPALSYFFSAAK